jgi:hypothetical protein
LRDFEDQVTVGLKRLKHLAANCPDAKLQCAVGESYCQGQPRSFGGLIKPAVGPATANNTCVTAASNLWLRFFTSPAKIQNDSLSEIVTAIARLRPLCNFKARLS